MQSETMRQVLDRLAAYGIETDATAAMASAFEGVPAAVRLRRKGSEQEFVLAYLPTMTLTHRSLLGMHDRWTHPILVVGEYIGARSSAAYRQAGIHYLDAAGNAHIEFADVLIDVRGRPRSHLVEQRNPDGAANLFSPRRAQVIFGLLAWPNLLNAPVRVISRTAGVSVGQAQSTMKLLEQTGHLRDGGAHRWRQEDTLVDHWTAAYPTGLGPTLRIRDFVGGISDIRRPEGDESLLVSGESAMTEFLRPTTLTVYTQNLNPKLAVLNRWRTDGPPNIFIRRKFWTQPGEQGSATPMDKFRSVPPLLIYADLMASGDSRQREAAAQLRGRDAGLRDT
ncbi:MAG: type IV toxin-antitoxin system AbiEi family antitoxin [Candidatus Nanopelagicales bacterium]|nr:type IV toxin-antitoxin system AbiEi family antitoxin [Candidatus Nanopelagicales bacterium]